MAKLSPIENAKLSEFLQMDSGYVLNFSDSTFGTFFGDFDIDINDFKYRDGGSSKAKKLISFFKQDSDVLVGSVLNKLIEYRESYQPESIDEKLLQVCKAVAGRLSGKGANLEPLKNISKKHDLEYMEQQLKRIEFSIHADPELAIGQAKELIETCCKTILNERKVAFNDSSETLPKLVKMVLDQLKILPDGANTNSSGLDGLKKILGSLANITHGFAEIRGAFGTGHGKDGRAKGLEARHARLVCNSTSAFVHFLFETHLEEKL